MSEIETVCPFTKFMPANETAWLRAADRVVSVLVPESPQESTAARAAASSEVRSSALASHKFPSSITTPSRHNTADIVTMTHSVATPFLLLAGGMRIVGRYNS
ncbi:MAG: hypothetical protein O3C40_22465 [Planctomycetota bacterium]|nr:hypothetical protein [Planctomycetota bacterium]